MSLQRTYKSYLLNRTSTEIQESLVKSLLQHGYRLEAHLASIYFNDRQDTTEIQLDGCIWSGRKAWIGSMLPVNANPGDIWMDTIEMISMIFIPVPREEVAEWSEQLLQRRGGDTNYAWISLRPVAKWQFQTFLQLAVRETYEPQVPPPFPVMDLDRIIDGNNMYSDAVNIIREEASIYALWFNKMTNSPVGWEYAYRFLNKEEFNFLWGVTKKEWINYFVDETTSSICTPETFIFDISEYLESEDPEKIKLAKSLTCNEWNFFHDVTFRTVVSSQIGLIEKAESSVNIGDIKFSSFYSR
jgi:hypothetical protein